MTKKQRREERQICLVTQSTRGRRPKSVFWWPIFRIAHSSEICTVTSYAPSKLWKTVTKSYTSLTDLSSYIQLLTLSIARKLSRICEKYNRVFLRFQISFRSSFFHRRNKVSKNCFTSEFAIQWRRNILSWSFIYEIAYKSFQFC